MKDIEITLLEQLHISTLEIDNRLKLLELNRDSLRELALRKPLIKEFIDEIVDEFYAKQTSIDEVSFLIGDADTLKRLYSLQRQYILDLFSGYYDNDYVNNRLRIGMVHKRIGVEPKLYLAGIRSLKETLFKVLKREIEDEMLLNRTLSTLDKLIYFDTTLVFDTYIYSLVGEVKEAKNKTEEYARSLEDKVLERTKQLEEQARLDALTNIFNRRAMYEMLRREIVRAKRHETTLCTIYFDLDNFKEINDKYGHIKGDEVLATIGQILKSGVREADIACRFGGDEFCVILPDSSLQNAIEISERIIELFTQKYPNFSISMGIAQTGVNGEFVGSEELIKRADENMYLAKKECGCQVKY